MRFALTKEPARAPHRTDDLPGRRQYYGCHGTELFSLSFSFMAASRRDASFPERARAKRCAGCRCPWGLEQPLWSLQPSQGRRRGPPC